LFTSGVLAGVAILAAGLLPSAASASTYTVTSTADAGPGTLRRAILDANAHPGTDSVRFNLPGPGVNTIAITSALPTVTETVVINGKSQPGYAGTPLVRIDNASASQLDGPRIEAAQCELLGLELTRFAVAVRLLGDANKVQGNLIGTNAAGDAGLGNSTGVRVESGAGNRIGGIAPGAPNVVSGNASVGVEVVGPATATTVAGNRIGTDPAGGVARANGVGVRVGGGSTANVIGGTTIAERNLISGNQQYGARLTGTDTAHNTVLGNYVGTTADGASALTNGFGIRVDGGASQNTIGGSSAGARNVISGNAAAGVRIDGAGTTGNDVAGNYVGTGPDGTSTLANGTGVRVASGASANTIGGATAGARNVISGNTGNGVEFLNDGTQDNTVAGNYIGVDATGSAELGNHYGVYVPAGPNTIGTPGAGNVISGNYGGVEITSAGNVVAANFIGTDATGTAEIHQGWGVEIIGVTIGHNTIGGTTAGARNVISGNGSGVLLTRTQANTVSGNYIGTDATGSAPLGNGGNGVSIFRGFQNTIGGTTPGARNVISANGFSGVHMSSGSQHEVGSNVVAGNYIGTDATGSAALGNGSGVSIAAGEFGSAAYNLIGGSTPAARNVISGNTGYGVILAGPDSNGDSYNNAVWGNYIGTNADGDAALPNGAGVHFLEGPGVNQNTIGGSTAGERNVISGNAGWGVVLSGNATYGDNTVTGNYIGTKSGGGKPLGNAGGGVKLELGAQDERVEANKIAFNGGPGVVVDGTPDVNGFVASGDSILGNSIYNNNGLGIDLRNGGNNDQAAPVITAVTTNGGSTTIDGFLNSTASTSFRIELFSSPSPDPSSFGEGKTFLGFTDVNTDGAGHTTFSSSVPAVQAGQFVTATATSATGDTSEFSIYFKSP
jgi:titin